MLACFLGYTCDAFLACLGGFAWTRRAFLAKKASPVLKQSSSRSVIPVPVDWGIQQPKVASPGGIDDGHAGCCLAILQVAEWYVG